MDEAVRCPQTDLFGLPATSLMDGLKYHATSAPALQLERPRTFAWSPYVDNGG